MEAVILLTRDMPPILKFLERYFPMSLVKYYLIGGIAVLLHVLIVVAVIEFRNFSPSIANALAFILATIFSSVANTYWSFDAEISRTIILRFWGVALLGLCLAITISSIAEYLKLHYLIGVLMVVTVTPVISYTLHKNWTYK